jgi:hypothetical protein
MSMKTLFISIAHIILVLASSTRSVAQNIDQPQAASWVKTHTLRHFPEKIFVHTDKEDYMTGEIIWFKLYYVDGFYHKPLSLSKLAYVTLIDQEGKRVLDGKISLKPGERSGSFLLPLSLSSGTYRMQAYTNWMKNEGEKLFFEKIITIINPLRDPDSSISHQRKDFEVGFYPEGGQLVHNLPIKVGFSIRNQFGKGIAGEGVVINERNDTVAHLRTYKFGMGQFDLKPRNQETYRAHIRLEDGTVLLRPLPEVKNQGYVMEAVRESGSRIRVMATTQEKASVPLHLVIMNRHRVLFTIRAVSRDGKAEWLVNEADLGEGINQLTVISGEGPECERLVFKNPSSPFSIKAVPGKVLYSNREEVSIRIPAQQLTDSLDLSVAVYKTDGKEQTAQGIFQYLHLLSELKGSIEEPEYYFSGKDSAAKALDNLLLTQGWRRFTWRDIDRVGTAPISHLPEYSGHLLTARLTDSISGRPVAGRTVFLTIPGAPPQFQPAKTDARGLAQFDLTNFYGSSQIMLRIDSSEGKPYRIKIEDPFYPSEKKALPIPDLRNLKASLEERNLSMQVQQVYAGDSLNIFYHSIYQDSLPFFGRGNYSYRLDDYRRFITMEEVLREYVREVNVIVRNGKLRMRLFDQDYREPREDDLLVLWDGLLLHEPNEVFEFDPLKIKKLEVIPRGFAMANRYFNGVLHFTSYNSDLPGLPAERILGEEYEGPQFKRAFFSPTYDQPKSKESRLPDFRQTLYWNPDVLVRKNEEQVIKFYSGDLKGKFLVVIQGMDPNGKLVQEEFPIEIQ